MSKKMKKIWHDKRFMASLLVICVIAVGGVIGIARSYTGGSPKIVVEGDYIEAGLNVVETDMLSGEVHFVKENFLDGIKVGGTDFVDSNRNVEASNLEQCKTWRLPEDMIDATSTAGGLNYEVPDSWKFITGGWFDVTNKTATTSFTIKVGLASDEEASSSIAFDDDTASTSANLINTVIATTTAEKLFFFTVNGGNATSVDANTDYDRVVGYASTSYESSDIGLCFSSECTNVSSTVIWGDLTVCYMEEPTLE